MGQPGLEQRAKDHEAMVRWQERAQQHRSAANNLFLTYSAALLGLEAAQLLSNEALPLTWPAAFELAGTCAAISFTVGSVVVLLRLRDARLTARIARLRYQGKEEECINAVRDKADALGKWTNRLIPCQVVSFFVGVAGIAAWIIATGWRKL